MNSKPLKALGPARPKGEIAEAIAVALVHALLTGQPVDEATLAATDPRALKAALAELKAGVLEAFPDTATHASTPIAWSSAAGRRLAARGRR